MSGRWTEMGFNAVYDTCAGAAILLFGLAMVSSTRYPSWVGAAGALWGVGLIAIGLLVAYVGFAPQKAGIIPPLTQLASLVWLVATAVILWRGSSRAPSQQRVAPHPAS